MMSFFLLLKSHSLYLMVTSTIRRSMISHKSMSANNDKEGSIWLFGLLKAKDKANLGQVVEQKLKASISLFITVFYIHIFLHFHRIFCTSLFCVQSASLLLL